MRAAALAALCSSTLASLPAFAGPADYVYSPIVEEGEREIDFKAGTAKLRDGGGRESAYSVGLGWGVNSWWFTEVYAKSHKEPGEKAGFDAFEWENKFQLTETGKYPVDIGLIVELERPHDRSEGYELRWGPLFQADLTNRVQANLNILVEKHYRAAEASKAELGYQWQLKYRAQPAFEYGLQGFGDVGPLSNWEPRSEQPHIAGPAIFGKLHVAPHQAISYNAGLLFGLTHGAPSTTLRMQAEYEF
ncbi:hypothetical protein IM725_08930 [Ramlibacter aquaticus]|uniref:Transporter n=1 Tax=Ramlibacter aquaticus TaxID=2780094 RepID=A0ABR9SEB7_9BURK|nr:hypothetical protein [Ramlibacter aquaticus]